MAHFAKLDENNVVLNVHVVNNEVLLVDGVESEQAGIDFLTDLHGHPNWKQTSYTGSFRKNYAGVGHIYSPTLDAFHVPQPYVSWSLNPETCLWEAPVAHPTTGMYTWDEYSLSWVAATPEA
jgi:hypothetical protein